MSSIPKPGAARITLALLAVVPAAMAYPWQSTRAHWLLGIAALVVILLFGWWRGLHFTTLLRRRMAILGRGGGQVPEPSTRTVALLTEMSEPLGRYSGNWLEVLECVDIMQGRRHPLSADLIYLTNILAGWMLHLAGHASSPEEGYLVSNKLLATGAACDVAAVAVHHVDTLRHSATASPTRDAPLRLQPHGPVRPTTVIRQK